MIVYLDTSALVKLFVNEPGTTAIVNALDEAGAVFTHIITYAEARAALAKAARMKRITSKRHASYKAALENYWDNIEVITLNLPLIKRAGNLAEIHALRGYDSIHLATAELVFRQYAEFTFACFDKNLNKAANELGIRTLA
ncbi:MAG: type II toxin-antitoxin system VapC family toxin [Mariprofundaceae bacterium]|nr:type II toxin-antitoxin system VapC family toxin [Mariprofundaceae bacterium]